MVIDNAVDTEIMNRVKSIIARQLDICPSLATPNARLREDLGADALDLVELIMAIGCEFGDQVLDEDFRHVHTFGELVAYIEQRCVGMRQFAGRGYESAKSYMTTVLN